MIEITNQCTDTYIDDVYQFSCARAILAAMVCLLIIIFCVYCIVQMYNFMKRLSFEVIPLTTTLLLALLQLILTIFWSDLRILIIALYFQAFTFQIVCTSFVVLYYRIKEEFPLFNSQNQSNNLASTQEILIRDSRMPFESLGRQFTLEKQISTQLINDHKQIRYIIIVMLIITLMSVFLMILTSLNLIPFSCSDFLDIGYLLPILLLSLFTIISTFFGIKLIKKINTSKVSTQQDNSLNILKKSKFLEDRRQQIIFVIVTFWLTVLLQFFMDVIREVGLKDPSLNEFQCDKQNDFYTIQANNIKGEVYLLFYVFIQLIPCSIVPYAFYYLPIMRSKQETNYILVSDIKEQEQQVQKRCVQDQQSQQSLTFKTEGFSGMSLSKTSSEKMIDQKPSYNQILTKENILRDSDSKILKSQKSQSEEEDINKEKYQQ